MEPGVATAGGKAAGSWVGVRVRRVSLPLGSARVNGGAQAATSKSPVIKCWRQYCFIGAYRIKTLKVSSLTLPATSSRHLRLAQAQVCPSGGQARNPASISNRISPQKFTRFAGKTFRRVLLQQRQNFVDLCAFTCAVLTMPAAPQGPLFRSAVSETAWPVMRTATRAMFSLWDSAVPEPGHPSPVSRGRHRLCLIDGSGPHRAAAAPHRTPIRR